MPGVGVWLASIEDVEPGEWPALYAQMDKERQGRCDRHRREIDKRRCILADALARRALSKGTDLAPEAISFGREPSGKPYALGLDKHFSLSHSGSLALCAVAHFPVGADIQRQRSISEPMIRRLARAGYEGTSDEDFFAWWVRQEAAGKMTGKGLSLRPIPEDLQFWDGVVKESDGAYFYAICAPR